MAPTPTPRLGLLKPDQIDLYSIAIPNGNMDILDRVGGITFATSTTRPALPFMNMSIFETDTGYHMVWDGDSWERISPGAVGGRRYEAANNILTTAVNNANEQLTGMETGLLDIIANRYYKITFLVEYDSTVANDKIIWRIRSTDLLGTQWTALQSDPVLSTAIRQQDLVMATVISGAVLTSSRFVLTMQRNAGTGTPRIYRSNTTRPFALVELMGHSSLLQIV